MNPEDRTEGEDVPEGCGPLRFDHLHTPATELAGVASKAAVEPQPLPPPVAVPASRRFAAGEQRLCAWWRFSSPSPHSSAQEAPQ